MQSGSLSVGLDSVATWCFDSGGTWTAGQAAPVVTKAKSVTQVVREEVPEAVYIASRGRGFAKLIADQGSMLLGLSGVNVEEEQGLAKVLRIKEGKLDDVMVMTFSEFGRRAKENGSKGTDHGSGAPVLLVGGKVKPGLVGKHPPLGDLDFGNLRHDIDFRQVYAAILDKWLGVKSKDVLGGDFKPVDILA